MNNFSLEDIIRQQVGFVPQNKPQKAVIEEVVESTPQSTPQSAPQQAVQQSPEQTPPQKEYLVVRDTVYIKVPHDYVTQNSLHLDGDVFEYNNQGVAVMIHNNKKFFITNKDFDDTFVKFSETVGSKVVTEQSAMYLDDYLRYHGKIPEYLEVKTSGTKGYGIFAKKDIVSNLFIGKYEGVFRPLGGVLPTNRYVFESNDFKGEKVASIDAENITFSNWTRFVNDSKNKDNLNCAYSQFNMNVLLFTTKAIKQGEELLASYGPDYWKTREQTD